MQPPRLAYSYIRFSSEKQQLGDSLRRQLSLAENYATQHNMILDSDSYRDMGISAFKGRNAVEGKLALFLRAIDASLIPPNAYLLVESLDRLSRTEVDDALNLFLSIIKRGVTIVTLLDGHEYSTETIKGDRGISLIISITIMMRAHEESVIKGMRCIEAWRARTDRGGILTKRCPSWIIYDNGKWRVDRRRAAVVRRIYRMYLAGLGCYVIGRTLNQEGVPTLRSARYWTHGLVTDLLRSPSVYGTMTRLRAPAIENYYPGIVSRADFERSQLIAKSRAWKGGFRNEQPVKLAMGVARCGGCGTRVQMVGGRGDSFQLRCGRSSAGAGCDARRVACRVAEKALLEDLLSPRHLVPFVSPAVTEAVDAIKTLEKSQRSLQAARDKLIQLALASSGVAVVAKRLGLVEQQLRNGLAQLALQRKIVAPQRSTDMIEARRLSAALVSGHVNDAERLAMRAALKPLIRRLFASIKFHPTLLQIELQYESGDHAVLTYEGLSHGFQKGHLGVARWGPVESRGRVRA